MRYQTSLFLRDGSRLSEIVRANNQTDALEKMACTRDIAYAPRGYAHPLSRSKPLSQDWRWDIRCSVNGQVTMSNTKPKAETMQRLKSVDAQLS